LDYSIGFGTIGFKSKLYQDVVHGHPLVVLVQVDEEQNVAGYLAKLKTNKTLLKVNLIITFLP
jgi:hypothetical protein